MSEEENRTYICIDLKSFYASVECVERHLDPLKARLLVADESRTDKTICLAASPALKALGVSSRGRLFEAKEKIHIYESTHHTKVDFIIAPPRMATYIRYSAKVYSVYLKYFSAEDIHVYSVDEVFIDITPYRAMYACSAHDYAARREIRSLNVLHKLVKRAVGVFHHALHTLDYLVKVMRRDIGSHTYGDTCRAVAKQVRES